MEEEGGGSSLKARCARISLAGIFISIISLFVSTFFLCTLRSPFAFGAACVSALCTLLFGYHLRKEGVCCQERVTSPIGDAEAFQAGQPQAGWIDRPGGRAAATRRSATNRMANRQALLQVSAATEGTADVQIVRGEVQGGRRGESDASSDGGAGSRETSPPARGVCETLDHDAIMRIVRLPTGVDRNEWIAHHIIALFEHVNALRGSVSEMCTAATCATMSYSGVAKLPWVDEKGKKHAYSAAQYMDSALTQCEQRCDDAVLFPTKHGQPFPAHFPASVAALTQLLWHLHERHWKHLESLNLVPQAALVFEHLARFTHEFGLTDAVEQKRIDEVVFVVRPPILEGTVPTPEV